MERSLWLLGVGFFFSIKISLHLFLNPEKESFSVVFLLDEHYLYLERWEWGFLSETQKQKQRERWGAVVLILIQLEVEGDLD